MTMKIKFTSNSHNKGLNSERPNVEILLQLTATMLRDDGDGSNLTRFLEDRESMEAASSSTLLF